MKLGQRLYLALAGAFTLSMGALLMILKPEFRLAGFLALICGAMAIGTSVKAVPRASARPPRRPAPSRPAGESSSSPRADERRRPRSR